MLLNALVIGRARRSYCWLSRTSRTASFPKRISTAWTYLSNGNVQSTTDANNVTTLICYDGNNLYPVQRLSVLRASLVSLPES